MTDAKQTLDEILSDARVAMVTIVAGGGQLESRPMTVQEYDNGVLRFLTTNDTTLGTLADETTVNAAVVNSNEWVSVAGRSRVTSDVELKRRMWSLPNNVFMDRDAEDPSVVVFELVAKSASFWDTPGTPGTLLGLIKGAISDDAPDLGEQHDVEL